MTDTPSKFSLILEVASLTRMFPTCDFNKMFFGNYESRNRELKTRPMYECRCNERLKTKSEKSTRLTYTGLLRCFVYYESINRKLKIKCICECRCYERLQTKTKEFTLLVYTGLVVELEHLKIETRLIAEMFVNVTGECEN